MKKLFLYLLVPALLGSCNSKTEKEKATSESVETRSPAELHGEGATEKMKSAIIETESDIPGKGKTTMKIVYDNYGKDQMTETNMTLNVAGHTVNNSTKSITKDGYMYSWASNGKSGTKFKLGEANVDPQNLDIANMTDEMRKKYNVKEEGTETIDGKTCKVFTYSIDQAKAKVWLYKQTPLQTEINIHGMDMITRFKKLEENPEIPVGTFDLPADVQFKEMQVNANAFK